MVASGSVDFGKVLTGTGQFLDAQGARWGVVGGLALHAWGLTRATVDLDLVVEEAVQGPLLRFLDVLGYERLHVSAGYSNHLHALAAMGRLDFVYVDPKTAERLFGQAVRRDILPGLQALVPRPEHLIAMKLHAMSNDPGRALRDLADVQFLLGLPGVDRDQMRLLFRRRGLEARFDELEVASDAQAR
jgi:hypothetical protein